MAYDKARVGLRIKSLRIDKGLSQKELSDMTDISQSTIVSYESGARIMRMNNAAKIADALGCSLDRLACRED